ncbi:MAG: pyridoxal phosphate-dependent aminotransferase [Bacteroidota bacterium]
MPIEIESPEQMGYDNLRFNLTESSMEDALLGDLKFDLKSTLLCYGDHQGKVELRQLLADEAGLVKNDVLLTPSAAAALFMVNTALLQSEDHLIVMRPNYATNIETPRAIGCEIDFVELRIQDQYRPDLNKIEKLIRPNTKLISITTPHNPTGQMLTFEELKSLSQLAEKHNIFLLVDETYRDLSFIPLPPWAASLGEKVISISSVSKAYGLPGIRMGWIMSKNKSLMELLLAAKEQIFISNSVVDEEIAFLYLKEKKKHLTEMQLKAKANFDILKRWLSQQDFLEYVLPQGGVVCFPRISRPVDIEKFYQVLNKKYGTFVGPGHWFEMDKTYFRIGFGCRINLSSKEDWKILRKHFAKASDAGIGH